MLRYPAGWNLALNCQLGDQVFHPTTLVHFRQRLLEFRLTHCSSGPFSLLSNP